MLYIHQLNHLTPKNAELECVYLVRELKQKLRYPLEEMKVRASLEPFRLQPQELQLMQEGLRAVRPSAEKITHLLLQRDPAHEPINIQRAIKQITELELPLQQNISYIQEILVWQEALGAGITNLLNAIPRLRTQEDKLAYNQKLKEIFSYILRNKEFVFNFSDVVGEAQQNNIRGLGESLSQGFFFKFTLEEELKKLDFNAIKMRLSAEQLKAAEDIAAEVTVIKRSIEKAYEVNMRMVQLAVHLYAYVKWMMNP